MNRRSIDRAAIEAETGQLRSLGLDALRQRWRATFGASPSVSLTKDLIARMIAYRLQEAAFGGLDRDTIRLLDRLRRGEKPNDLNRRLKSGTVLVREYNGERHTVTVVAGGFVWEGATYSSLSTIARAITGTAWNGPRFFGLRGAVAMQKGPAERTPQRKRSAIAPQQRNVRKPKRSRTVTGVRS